MSEVTPKVRRLKRARKPKKRPSLRRLRLRLIVDISVSISALITFAFALNVGDSGVHRVPDAPAIHRAVST